MTSGNEWFGKIKSRAKVVGEQAKNRIEKLTETLDKKLKEAQEDLEKQRSRAEASEQGVQLPQKWQPSQENPDGKIVQVAKPPPTISPTAPLSPETPPTPTLPEEPPTVVRSRGKRRAARKNGFLPTTSISLETENDSGSEQKSLYFKGKDNSQDIILCLNDIINNIVEQENINNCVNQSVDIISTVDELVENTASIVIPQKEDLVAAQNLTSHSENNINRKKEESLSSVNELDREGILTNMPVDEFTPATDIDNAPIAYPDQENVQTEILNETLPTLTKSDDIPFERSDTEDELSTMTNVVESPIKHIESEDELPTLNNVVQSPNEHFDPADELPVLTNVVESPAENSNPEDQFAMLPNIDNTPIAHPDPENNQMEILNDESSALTNISVTPTEHSHSQDEVSVLKNDVQPPIEHSDSNANDSITLEDSIITPPNEFEDSFDALKTPTIQITRPSEDPLEKLTDLAALREFISKLDDDIDVDEEASPPKHDTISINEKVINQSEQQDTPDITEDTSSSFQTSISNDIQEYASSESTSQTDLSIDEPSIDDKIENTSTALIEETLVEKKRFSVVNCHSIPPGVKIIQMICSSTYVYICTNDRKIFYAKLNLSNTDLPLKWQQHSDPAERLIVSVTNRTVWRLSNKRLYSSNDPLKFPPIGSQWNEIKIGNEQSFLSISINDQCGWYIKEDGSLWLIRTNDETCEALNVACPFNLNKVFCFSEKVGVTTCDGEILIRVGCTDDCLEGDGWIFIDHSFGPIDDFILLTNNNIISIVDKKHRLWLHQWTSDKGFFEILCNDGDEDFMSRQRYLMSVNSEFVCLTDCQEQINIFSDCLTGIQWTVVEKNTRLQRLIGAFSDENYVWALTTDRMICSSNGQTFEKPRQAQYLTHATFVPDNSSQDTILWTLDESCNIYVRANVESTTRWEQLDQSQFEWNRRLVHIVCNKAGVWAVDDQGYIHFRHGHISASQNIYSDELSLLPPAWIPIPGEPERYRCFSQIYCGPADWMVYATDNKQTVYARIGINEENGVGTSWKAIEDCSALELAVSEHTLWLLTSFGQIQCRENISITNPIGTRSTTLPGFFLSLTVSMDDSQVWALNSKRDLMKLDRLTVLLEK